MAVTSSTTLTRCASDAVFDQIEDVEVPDDMLDLATHIIERKLSHFDAKRFEDRYQDALSS